MSIQTGSERDPLLPGGYVDGEDDNECDCERGTASTFQTIVNIVKCW